MYTITHFKYIENLEGWIKVFDLIISKTTDVFELKDFTLIDISCLFIQKLE